MNVFLTGEKHIGKSSVVDGVLAAYGGPLHGFRSRKLAAGAGGASAVCLFDVRNPEKRYTVAIVTPEGPQQVSPEAFDNAGADILRAIGPGARGLVVMDEIGFLENNSPLFLREIERVLALDVPVLAVLRKGGTPFLNRLAVYPGAKTIEVTTQNRKGLPKECMQLLGLGIQSAQ